MSSSSRKPVRRSPSRTAAAPVAPPVDVEPAAPVDPAEPVARYTWPEIRARVADADKASLATYRVAVAPKRLVEEGSLIASERILTDLRIWLGQIIDWWTALSPAERGLVEGFSEARLRVVTHHAFALQELLARATKKHAASKHAAAVAIADDVYRQAQAARSQPTPSSASPRPSPPPTPPPATRSPSTPPSAPSSGSRRRRSSRAVRSRRC